jgi:phosphoribosylformylglycinamidine cyclo-ligase
MGIGMVLAVDSSIADEIVKYLNNDNEQAYLIGEVVNGEAGVDIC